MIPDGAASPLSIRLFGGFEVLVNGQPLPRLRFRKSQAVLALLALRQGGRYQGNGWMERERLAALLWPDSGHSHALHCVRNCLSDLRAALGSEARRLHSPASHTVALDLTGAFVDVLAFDAALAQADPRSWEAAVSLYRGPLLEGSVEECLFQERQSREQGYLAALERLAALALEQGDVAAAERHLRSALAVDPLREEVQRTLMELLAANGNYAAALVAYRDLRLRLHREANTEPDPETRALFERLRAEARVGVSAKPTGSAGPRAPGARNGREQHTSPHHLPLQLTSFIGRQAEVAEVRQRLTATRLVTLTGAGGCGKTRLALEVAAGLLGAYPDGTWFVELAPLADPALVPKAVANALTIREQPDRRLIDTLVEALKPKQLLLVLDNCEHLVAACAKLAEALLRTCPHLRILATSREPLRIPGEQPYRVPSLSTPGVQAFRRSGVRGSNQTLPERLNGRTPERLLEYEAVRLLHLQHDSGSEDAFPCPLRRSEDAVGNTVVVWSCAVRERAGAHSIDKKESEMKREALPLALLVALPVVLLGVAPAQAATKISSFGYAITAPGVYQVTQDLSGSGDAITVSASNVDLHLGGHILTGDGSGVGVHVEGSSPVYNVSIHNGTVQGFQRGIFLGFFALNCKVSSVTASGNTEFGIFLSHANGNIVTNNAVTQTGAGYGTGIGLDASNGNTVTRNTTDGNYAGIDVSDNSSGNTVSRNTATSNPGQGIRLLCGPTQNSVQDNTCSGNGIGIAVGLSGCDGANQNIIQNNTVNYNFAGILVEPNCTGNTLQGNTALTNANVDLEDDNPGCDTNTWANNTFATDLVAGVSDGGPGFGCIR